MTRTAKNSMLALAMIPMVLSCHKTGEVVEPPPINDLRTYDRVAVAVKEDPLGGFILLCKNTPIDGRTSELQVIHADGTEGDRIGFDALPLRVEDVVFDADELLYTDFAKGTDGSIFIVGTARQPELQDRLHLVVQRIGADGVAGIPFRRFLVQGAVVGAFDDADLQQDLDGLPRQRALCELRDAGHLLVAVRWETLAAAGIRLYEFNVSESGGATSVMDIPLGGPTHRLHQFGVDPSTGHVVVVVDVGNSPGQHQLHVSGYSTTSGQWIAEGSSVIAITGAEPQQLVHDGQGFVLTGYAPEDGNDGVKPFYSRFPNAAQAGIGASRLELVTSAERPVTTYCSASRGGVLEFLLHVHESSALPPYFAGDISSDLLLADLGGAQTLQEPRIIIPGQGLRAIGMFNVDGTRVVIGTLHPYLNGSYVHTFYLVVNGSSLNE